MGNLSYPAGGSVSKVTTDAEFSLGTKGHTTDGADFVYIKAGSAVSQYNAVGILHTGVANPLTKAMADAGRLIGVPQIAMAINEYGWACIRSGEDTVKVKVLASCAPDVRLYTTSTAGSLDDTSASQSGVFGIVIVATAGASAGAGNGLTVRARIGFPTTEATA